ncbi:MAG: AAA family ATPase [Verrucomicrobia bacterium]|nr:AAA family ATPase [Verrucomicrobiota bacterium]
MSFFADAVKTVGPTVAGAVGTVFAGWAVKTAWDHSDKIDDITSILPWFSTTSAYTKNLIEEARKDTKGAYPKIFGRNSELNLLEDQLSSGAGLIFLLGESGVGKSTIVYELVRRIANKESTEYLNSAVILSLDLKKLFPQGFGAMFKSLVNGGMVAVIQKIVRELENTNLKGKITFLFIDEFQDLLKKGNEKLFDDMKAELAKNGIHIIGASMDPEDITYWIKKEKGMSRRAELIQVLPLGEAAMVEALTLSMPSILEEFAKKNKFHERQINTPVVEDGLVKTSIFFSNIFYADIVEPNRSSKLFRQLISHLCSKKSHKSSWGEQDVVDFIRATRSHQVNFSSAIYKYEQQKADIESRKQFQQTEEVKLKLKRSFRQSYFPKTGNECGQTIERVQQEVTSLTRDIQNLDTDFPIVREYESKEFAKDIIGHISSDLSRENLTSCYSCSIKELRTLYTQYLHLKHKLDVKEFIEETLRIRENDVLIVTDADDILWHLQDKQTQKNLSQASNRSPAPLLQAANQIAQQGTQIVNQFSQNALGTNLIPYSSTLVRTPPPKPQPHLVDAIFIEFIEQKRIKTVLIKTYSKPIADSLTPKKLNVTTEDNIQWLASKLPKEIEGENRQVIATKLVDVERRLNLSSFSDKSPVDACCEILSSISKKTGGFTLDGNWIDSLVEVAPNLGRPRIASGYEETKQPTAVKPSSPQKVTTARPEQAATEPTYTYVSGHFPPTLHNLLSELQRERDNSIPLLIGDDCPCTLMFRKSQVASWLADRNRKVEWGFHEVSTQRDKDTVLLLDAEQIVNCEAAVKEVMNNGVKVIIFGKTSILPIQGQTGDLVDNISKIAQSGVQLVGTLTGNAQNTSPAKPPLWPSAKIYRSEPLSAEEKRVFLQFQIDTAIKEKGKLPDEPRATLVKTYTYLWERLKRNANGIAEDIMKDISRLSLDNLDRKKLVEFFDPIGPGLGLHPLELTYLLTPEATPWGYWVWRKVTDPILYMGQLVLWSIQSLMNYATGQIMGWITGLPFWKLFAGLRRITGW